MKEITCDRIRYCFVWTQLIHRAKLFLVEMPFDCFSILCGTGALAGSNHLWCRRVYNL